MKRIALLLALATAATLLPATTSPAGIVSDDVYRSHFVARDRDGRAHVIEAVVEDRPAGAQLVIEIRRRCGSCRPDVYAKALDPDEFTVRMQSFGVECQCFSATVETKFGRRPLRIDWVWDPEQGGGAAGGGFEWSAVTANNLLNVSCFGSGSHTSTPALLSGDAPAPPKGARKFPERVPPGFRPDLYGVPGCYTESP